MKFQARDWEAMSSGLGANAHGWPVGRGGTISPVPRQLAAPPPSPVEARFSGRPYQVSAYGASARSPASSLGASGFFYRNANQHVGDDGKGSQRNPSTPTFNEGENILAGEDVGDGLDAG